MDAIFNRRSIRKYTNQPVTSEQITQLLRAAMAAPSAGNQQPWEFIVVRNRNKIDEVINVHPYSKMLSEASVAIVVCGNESKEKHKGYWVQDCSAAIQNILLEATDIGLGTVWLGVFPNQERVKVIKKIFVIPQNITPLGIVSIGYPDEEFKQIDRFRENVIHYDSWSNK